MLSALILMLAAPDAPFATRCGWLHNPTPGNWALADRDGEWTLATQGADGAPGWGSLDFTRPRQWVATNGSYGLGCACASMRVDRASTTVLAIRSLTPRPLAACRRDPRLPKP